MKSDKPPSRRILVTGATGFVGRALCRHLLDKNYDVIGVLRSEQASSRLVSGVVPLFCGDIESEVNWSAALENIDTVVHLAARVHVLHEKAKNPAESFCRVNVDATRNLAKAAAQMGVRRFVFLSTVKVNGENSDRAFCEKDPPAPQDHYSASKYEAEQALRSICSESRLECVILRPPLVYGEEVRANFHKLMQLVNSGIPLPFGSINNSRSMLYVGNLTSAIAACIHHPGAAGQTFFVSDGEDLSTPDLIRGIAKGLSRPCRLIDFPSYILNGVVKIAGFRETLMRLTESLTVDSSKIKDVLDWQPPFSVDQGIARTTLWLRKQSSR